MSIERIIEREREREREGWSERERGNFPEHITERRRKFGAWKILCYIHCAHKEEYFTPVYKL
jgi:hypothetical protein